MQVVPTTVSIDQFIIVPIATPHVITAHPARSKGDQSQKKYSWQLIVLPERITGNINYLLKTCRKGVVRTLRHSAPPVHIHSVFL